MQLTKPAIIPGLGGLWLGARMLIAALRPNRQQWRTLIAALRKGGFDRRFYRATYRHLPPLHRMLCLMHYVCVGEKSGLWPNPNFSPNDYLRLNPDVAKAGVPPFWHWLTHGRGECRLTRLPDIPDQASTGAMPLSLRNRAQKARFAIYIHLFYPDLWPEFSRQLGRISLNFDLYVTLSFAGPERDALRHRIRTEFNEAEVIDLPNRGRDILPFLTLLNAGAFDGYDAVCKLHGKRSPHRPDGDAWRRKLVSGILPRQLARHLKMFLDDTDAAVWVADGQMLDTQHWWGDNKTRCTEILSRIELGPDLPNCPFPAGSVYWIKPFAISLLKSLQLCHDDFEPEIGMLDGTTAHAVERILGQLVQAAAMRVVETSQLRPCQNQSAGPSYVTAFYLPQFHRIAQNDLWWGQGYTEWQAARRAKPVFHDHLQPARPLAEYDLSDPAVMAHQSQQARMAGVDAFCVYFYWFDGKRLLETPLDNLLTRPDLSFPFYLCWANESWRRNWDGQSGEVLMKQQYAPGFEAQLARDLMPYLRDPRYQRPDDKRPRFVIYRPADLPDVRRNVERLRLEWRRLGIGEVEIGAVLTSDFTKDDPFDFWVEMPPHGLCRSAEEVGGALNPTGLCSEFEGFIYDFSNLMDRAFQPEYLARLPRNTIRGVMPSWDNTARRGNSAHIAYGGNPARFSAWLRRLRDDGLEKSYRQEMFVNAWNEWGEKAMLEPSERFGDLNLRAISSIRNKA